ncbi:hypothetical protein [Kiloniella sp.]|uniref:hypothetical protein n=1 Tax=Kiloniella sp. TaxID=1938587 RepID=UPI003B02281E
MLIVIYLLYVKLSETIHINRLLGGRHLFLLNKAEKSHKLEELLGVEVTLDLYLIRNTKIVSSYESVLPTFLNVSRRSLEVLIKQQGVSNISQIYLLTQRDGFDFYLSYVPGEFDYPLPEPFDNKYMRELYSVGYEIGKKGVNWKRQPPELLDDPSAIRPLDITQN